MFTPTTFRTALLMTLISTVCWGSWVNAHKLTKRCRFELFYWDYVIGAVLTTLVLALTMGSLGGPDGFVNNVRSADASTIVLALLAGFIFNICNVLMLAGIEMAGLAIAFPLSSGISIVEGVLSSYALQPKGDRRMLGLGVAFALLAVIADGKAYGSLRAGSPAASRKGIIVCALSGLVGGAFPPFVTRALTADRPLTPYSIAVFFTAGMLLCCFCVNAYFMRKPLVGEPIGPGDYLRLRPADHLLGVVGGVVWGVGSVCNLAAASFVGVAIAYAIGMAAPMVAALWGIFVWKEFRGASAAAKTYLAATLLFYLLAIFVIAAAYDVS